jgi:hypothetical protein
MVAIKINNNEKTMIVNIYWRLVHKHTIHGD